MSVARIHDLVREGRCSPADAAVLIEIRHRIAWCRRPWWSKLGAFLLFLLFEVRP